MRVVTLLLSRGDVAALLPMGDCIDAVERALAAQAGDVPSGVLGLHVPAGGFHVKAACLRLGRLYVAAKINANFPGNPEACGLPTIQGILALYDGENGRPLAVMDSIEVTALRTAAATAVAAKAMARPDARTVALCGCGTQGAYQLRALAHVRPIDEVHVHDRDPARAARLAAELSAETGWRVTVAADWRAAARKADIVVTCTTSREPIVGPDDVAAGCFLAGVGADNPLKQEIDPRLMARGRVVVDSREQAAAIGDLHHAVDAGTMRKEDVHAELWEVVTGLKPGRVGEDEVTIFDSTGIAIEDVAAAALVYERATAGARGAHLDFSA